MVCLCVVYCVAVWLVNFVRYFANYVNILQGVEQKMTYVNSSSSRNSFHLVCSKGLSPLVYFGAELQNIKHRDVFVVGCVRHRV